MMLAILIATAAPTAAVPPGWPPVTNSGAAAARQTPLHDPVIRASVPAVERIGGAQPGSPERFYARLWWVSLMSAGFLILTAGALGMSRHRLEWFRSAFLAAGGACLVIAAWSMLLSGAFT